jgi:hypothetical protein
MWRNGNLSLRRIYSSWEELEANFDVVVDKEKSKTPYVYRSCPYCGVTQKVTKSADDLFPYEKCQSCKRPFHVKRDLTVRTLTEEERENMPENWVRILEDLNKKKLAVVFKLE